MSPNLLDASSTSRYEPTSLWILSSAQLRMERAGTSGPRGPRPLSLYPNVDSSIPLVDLDVGSQGDTGHCRGNVDIALYPDPASATRPLIHSSLLAGEGATQPRGHQSHKAAIRSSGDMDLWTHNSTEAARPSLIGRLIDQSTKLLDAEWLRGFVTSSHSVLASSTPGLSGCISTHPSRDRVPR